MLIEKLELKGYKRITLSGIEHMTFTPTAIVQLILGTNGSGKSSLLSELSPLPANPAHYNKDGYKRIWISHKGRSYFLESVLKGSNHHSFICDGEELNPGHTGAVQKDLAKEHFNWTQPLHDLLTGLDRFTHMSPSKRREWFAKLSTQDYTYANRVYQTLASRNRDSVGAVKHLNQRLTTEANNLKALEGLNGLEDRIGQLRSEVNLLLTSLDPSITRPNESVVEYERQLTSLMAEIARLSEKIVGHRTKMPAGMTFDSYQEIVDALSHLSREQETARQLLDRATKEYAELDELSRDLGQSGDEIPEDLDEQITAAQQMVAERTSQLRRFGHVPNAERTFRDNQSVLDALIGLFSTMPDNSDRRYSREHVTRITNERQAMQQELDQSETKLMQIRHRRGIILAAKESTCPSCGYVWKEGFSQQELEQLQQWQDEHTAIVERLTGEIQSRGVQLEEMNEVFAQYSQLRQYMQSFPNLQPLWNEILEKQLQLNNPSESKGMFVQWAQDTEVSMYIDQMTTRVEQLQLLARRKADGTLNHIAHRRGVLTAEIEAQTVKIRSLKTSAAEIELYRQSVDFVIGSYEEMVRLQERSTALYEKLISALRNQHINRVVHGHQDELSTIQRQLSEKQTLEGIVRDLETSRRDVSIRQQALSLLARELSPTEGLIAEEMSGFIGCVVNQMNAIIEQVWTYDLIIQPCGIESGDLDYKFPLFSGPLAKDVYYGSVGQQDIINYAFIETVMLYLDLTDVPRYLDEPGSSFDEHHRLNLMRYVRQMVDSHQYGQLFLISHYANQYGGFSNAETMVIDGTNIAVPLHANKHVTFA